MVTEHSFCELTFPKILQKSFSWIIRFSPDLWPNLAFEDYKGTFCLETCMRICRNGKKRFSAEMMVHRYHAYMNVWEKFVSIVLYIYLQGTCYCLQSLR